MKKQTDKSRLWDRLPNICTGVFRGVIVVKDRERQGAILNEGDKTSRYAVCDPPLGWKGGSRYKGHFGSNWGNLEMSYTYWIKLCFC